MICSHLHCLCPAQQFERGASAAGAGHNVSSCSKCPADQGCVDHYGGGPYETCCESAALRLTSPDCKHMPPPAKLLCEFTS